MRELQQMDMKSVVALLFLLQELLRNVPVTE